jgi:protein transport protein SEC31
LIRENIILGNLEAAIDCALVCGRTAEALIIAHQGGPELFNITQEAVLNSSKDRFLKNNLLNLLKKDVGEIIENCEYGKWKEVLAILIINNSKPAVVAQFAEKLEDAGFNEAAEVCYIYSGYSERVIESWVRKYRQALSDGEDRESEIFSLFFKALLHSESFNFSGSELLERIYLEYLSLLFSKGLISQGFDIMKQLKTPKHSMALMIFVERHTKANTGTSKAPWKLMNIVPVKGKDVKPVEVKKQDRPVFTRENVVPDVKKAAFNEIPKPVRPVPEPVRQPEPLRQAFPEPPKPVFQEGKSARPVVDKGNLPPPPPVFHSNAEIKKSPFGEIKTVGPSLESKQITPASGTSNASLPPPPPIKKESKVDPPPLRQEFKTVEHPSRPEPKEDLIPPPENPKPRPEERKSVTLSTPSPSVPFAPSVPKTIPPPRPGVGFPLKPQSKSLKPTTEGLDLSGIPASSLSISQKWETSFQDWCTGNNAKIIKDVESKLQEFFNKLKSQEINEVTLSQVRSLTEAFESGDFNTTNKEYLELCSRNWEENKNWLTAMKRIIQGKQAPKGK